MEWIPNAMIFMIPIVGSVAVFVFMAVAVWAQERRREREAYYEYELRKRMVDAGKMDAADLRELMQFESDAQLARRKQGMLIAGLVVAGSGLGVCLGLRFIQDEAVWMVGLIPLAVGLGMLAYALVFAPDVPSRPRVTRDDGPASR